MLTGRSCRFAKLTTCIVIAVAACGRLGTPRPRSLSPRRILTGLVCGSANETISAISALSAAGFCGFLSGAGELPRTTFTAPHPVSGKVTRCTLPALLSIACLRISTVMCRLAFEAASALHAGASAATAPKQTLAQIPPRIAPSIGAGDRSHPQGGDILAETAWDWTGNSGVCQPPITCQRIERSTCILAGQSVRRGDMAEFLVIHGAV